MPAVACAYARGPEVRSSASSEVCNLFLAPGSMGKLDAPKISRTLFFGTAQYLLRNVQWLCNDICYIIWILNKHKVLANWNEDCAIDICCAINQNVKFLIWSTVNQMQASNSLEIPSKYSFVDLCTFYRSYICKRYIKRFARVIQF